MRRNHRVPTSPAHRAGPRQARPARRPPANAASTRSRHAVNQPMRMITSSRSRESSAPCQSIVASRSFERPRQRRMVSTRPGRCSFGHVVGLRRLIGGGLGLPYRQPWNATLGQGVTTPCTGGTPSRSPAIVARDRPPRRGPTQPLGRSGTGTVRTQQIERRTVCRRVDTERAEDRSPSSHHVPERTQGGRLPNPRPCDDDVPAVRTILIACANAAGALGGDVDDDIGQPPAAWRSAATDLRPRRRRRGRLPKSDASASRSAPAAKSASPSQTRRPPSPAAATQAHARLARARRRHRLHGPGQRCTPTDPAPNRFEYVRENRIEIVRQRQDHRIRCQVLIFGITAHKPGRGRHR